MKYIDIISKINELQEILEENLGELNEKLEEELDSLNLEVENKIIYYNQVLENTEIQIQKAQNVIEKYKKILEQNKNTNEFFKERLLNILEKSGTKNLSDKDGNILKTFSILETESLIVKEEINLEHIPNQFLIKKEYVSVDKNSLKKAIKNGEFLETEDVFIQKNKKLKIK